MRLADNATLTALGKSARPILRILAQPAVKTQLIYGVITRKMRELFSTQSTSIFRLTPAGYVLVPDTIHYSG